MHIEWSYTKFCWKKCVLENLCFFLLECLLKIASFYSDVAVVFVLKAVEKRITFFIGNQIRHDVYQNLSNALYINAIFWIYRKLFFYGVVDTFLNLILCWSSKFGHLRRRLQFLRPLQGHLYMLQKDGDMFWIRLFTSFPMNESIFNFGHSKAFKKLVLGNITIFRYFTPQKCPLTFSHISQQHGNIERRH